MSQYYSYYIVYFVYVCIYILRLKHLKPVGLMRQDKTRCIVLFTLERGSERNHTIPQNTPLAGGYTLFG